MSEIKPHTQLPWKNEFVFVDPAAGQLGTQRNKRFAIHAANAHEKLVEVLEEFVRVYRPLMDSIEWEEPFPNDSFEVLFEAEELLSYIKEQS